MSEKKKIETFGRLVELLINEPDNVYSDSENGIVKTKFNKMDTIYNLKSSFDAVGNYYHIPQKKKKIMAVYYGKGNGQMHVFEVIGDGLHHAFHKKPNSEFEVDE